MKTSFIKLIIEKSKKNIITNLAMEIVYNTLIIIIPFGQKHTYTSGRSYSSSQFKIWRKQDSFKI